MPRINAKALRINLRFLTEQREPKVEEAFEESVADLRENVAMTALVAAIERKDMQGAVEALNIEAAAFQPLRDTLWDVFDAAGKLTMFKMPPLEKKRGNLT